MRPSGRKLDEMRTVSIEAGVMKHAEGSCLIKMGDTHVLCSASIEDKPPSFLKGTGLGWVTAEYGMLPRATGGRTKREAALGKQSGRTQEIQRLIGRALRAGLDRSALGERQIVVDCDVIQADGGTRCASITGGWVALRLAVNKLMNAGEDIPVFLQANLDWHVSVVRASHNELLIAFIAAISGSVYAATDLAGFNSVDVRHAVGVAHQRVMDAIEARNADSAARRMGRHVGAYVSSVASREDVKAAA